MSPSCLRDMSLVIFVFISPSRVRSILQTDLTIAFEASIALIGRFARLRYTPNWEIPANGTPSLKHRYIIIPESTPSLQDNADFDIPGRGTNSEKSLHDSSSASTTWVNPPRLLGAVSSNLKFDRI
jgi:hypothetical protein